VRALLIQVDRWTPLVVTGRSTHCSVENNEDHLDRHIGLGDNTGAKLPSVRLKPGLLGSWHIISVFDTNETIEL
jgi:hypothetical protein